MAAEDAAEDAWIAAYDERCQRASENLAAFLDWWDENPSDRAWFVTSNPHLWRRFLAYRDQWVRGST